MDRNSTAHEIEIGKLGAMMRMHLLVTVAWKHFSRREYQKGNNLEAFVYEAAKNAKGAILVLSGSMKFYKVKTKHIYRIVGTYTWKLCIHEALHEALK